MTDRDRELHRQLGKELDDVLFANMEMNERLKRKIREAAANEQTSCKWTFAKSWKTAAAGMLAALIIVVAIPLLGQPDSSTPIGNPTENVPPGQTNGGASGTELSQLTTTTLGSIEAAKTAFGEGLRLPAVVPKGYALTDMAAVGIPGQPARDILFTYTSGERTLTFSASRMASAFPVELFSKTKVGNVDGFIFEQPGMTELFWTIDEVHYGVTGPITGDEAVKMAESAAF